jgi:uncharacterized SAM-dependent methyltransferase
VVFFPGSTIGNFDRSAAIGLMKTMRAMATLPFRQCRPGGASSRGGGLVIGFDLVKDSRILERAYDDAAGVTAEFNLNMLERLNRELGATFEIGRFRHQAVWVPKESRIEMRLVSQIAQQVFVAGEAISFEAEEPIITEHCHKYTPEMFARQAREAGWVERRTWTDPAEYFFVQYLERDG